MIGFGAAIQRGFRQYCVWRGRATCSEYWFFALFSFIVMFVAEILVAVSGVTGSLTVVAVVVVLCVIIYLGLILPLLAVLIRRLHDTDRSGGWYWIGLVPFVGTIILIVFLCQASTPGPNRYGPPVIAGPQPYPPYQPPYQQPGPGYPGAGYPGPGYPGPGNPGPGNPGPGSGYGS